MERMCKQCLLEEEEVCEVESLVKVIDEHLLFPEEEKKKAILEIKRIAKEARLCPKVVSEAPLFQQAPIDNSQR